MGSNPLASKTSIGQAVRETITHHENRALQAGARAPDFSLPSTSGRNVALRDQRGHPVVLVFYPADWTPVCADQLALYNEILDEFRQFDAQLLGISVDSVWSHRAFANDRRLRFPLLADFEPKGDVSRRYGVYDEDAGVSERALFVIDAEGVISWSYVAPMNVNPGADGILRALERMRKRAVMPGARA